MNNAKCKTIKGVFNCEHKKQIELHDCIIPTDVRTYPEKYNQRFGNHEEVLIKDYVFIDGMYDYGMNGQIHDLRNEIKSSATDYAVANGATVYFDGTARDGKKGTVAHWLRTAWNEITLCSIDDEGDVAYFRSADRTDLGVVPVMKLDIKALIKSPNFRKFKTVQDRQGNAIYPAVEFGYYPQTKVENNNLLETIFQNAENLDRTALHQGGNVLATGKEYTGYLQDNGQYAKHLEYEINHQKFVRVVTKDNAVVWVKVEPITWEICNWEDLPKTVNPNGKGTAQFMKVRASEALIGGMPFYPNTKDQNCSRWQNSSIRGYLNGINVCNIKENGDLSCTAPHGGDFSVGGNFLNEALSGLSARERRMVRVHSEPYQYTNACSNRYLPSDGLEREM